MTGRMTPQTDVVIATTQFVLVDTGVMVGVIVVMNSDGVTSRSIGTGVVAVVTATRKGIACWLTRFSTGAICIITTGVS